MTAVSYVWHRHPTTRTDAAHHSAYGSWTCFLAADRLKGLLGAAASSNINVATALAYAGYSYVLLGEGWCESPVNLSAPIQSDSLLRVAISRFNEAITVATAVKQAGGANVNAAQDLIYMSDVGAARAALKVGDLALSRTYAVQVPTNYEKLAYYSSNTVRENNALNALTHAAGASLGMFSRFQGLNDPRVPQPAATQLGLTGGNIYTPLTPFMYTGWVASGTAPRIDVNFDIKFATGLEAQYDIAEADGPTPATLTFVNARRAAGGQGAVALTGAALMTELANIKKGQDMYSQAWVSFAYGRDPNPNDQCVANTVSSNLNAGGPIVNVLSDLTQADSFRMRVRAP